MALSSDQRAAIIKAQRINGAALVRRVRHGVYRVPSASQPGVLHTVTGTAMDASDHHCTCHAGQHGRICWHVAAVRLARVQAEALRQAATLAVRRAEAKASPARPRATATIRIGGIEYQASGRNVLDAIGQLTRQREAASAVAA